MFGAHEAPSLVNMKVSLLSHTTVSSPALVGRRGNALAAAAWPAAGEGQMAVAGQLSRYAAAAAARTGCTAMATNISIERVVSSLFAATSYPMTSSHLLSSRRASSSSSSPLKPPRPDERLSPQQQPDAPASVPEKSTPAWYRLLRLDKPTGTLLLLSPCLWSIGLATSRSLATLDHTGALASAQQATTQDGVTGMLSTLATASPLSYTWYTALPPIEQSLVVAALFSFGAVCLRGAGCTVNDILDRELDAKVERTRERPLASGEMRPIEAVAVLGATLTLGLGVLLQLNPLTQVRTKLALSTDYSSSVHTARTRSPALDC